MPSAEDEYRIYALTRSSSSAAAKALRESENEERLQIVEGDLDDRESIVRIFERVSGEEGGFWGVYCVLEFPGLGADATGEERRGKVGFCFSFFLSSFLSSPSTSVLGMGYFGFNLLCKVGVLTGKYLVACRSSAQV